MNVRPLWQDLLRLWLLAFAALLVIYGPLVIDPLVRHDDFPALLGQKFMAHRKALDEGRWLNYWWQFRPFLWSSPVSFALYLMAWATFSACTSITMLGREAPGWYKGYFALFVALSIPAFMIAFWFNTLLPGVWIITFYALGVVFLPHRVSVALLIVAVPLSFMAYTTYPFLLMALALMSYKAPKTYKSMAITLFVFFFSLGVGMLSVYSLNYIYHGVFGIPIADWRAPSEVQSTEDLIRNLGKLRIYLQTTIRQLGGGAAGSGVVLLAFFAIGWGILFRSQRFVAITVLVAMLAGLVPLLGKSLMSGVFVPARAFGWIWLLLGFTFTAATLHLSLTPGRVASIARITIMYVLLIKIILFGRATYVRVPPWQEATRDLASAIPDTTETVYIYGHYLGLTGAGPAGIQFPRGLRLRLVYLTGLDVVICDETPDECADVEPPIDPRGWTHIPIIESEGNQTFMLMPYPPIGP
ncbi:hypothetical protein [Ruegeria sp. HKCCA5426]|uniref:hypothetical protein n=1 Tax=Ruegeria sp. HKCCA5426 TaxID=2682985 RepID=UPI001488740C|nr:hypothetical protein [Ruegeria sp. HKCCA5426]